MEIFRGDIYYVNPIGYICRGSEQGAGRPTIIVSNNKSNIYSSIVEIVYLTASPKKQLPTHVPILCKVMSTALCEQVHSVDKKRLTDYVRCCTKSEMEQIDEALRISLELPLAASKQEKIEDDSARCATLQNEIIKTSAERDVYKGLYEQLLKSRIKGV